MAHVGRASRLSDLWPRPKAPLSPFQSSLPSATPIFWKPHLQGSHILTESQ